MTSREDVVRGNLDQTALALSWDPATPQTTANFTTSLVVYDSLGKAIQIDIYFGKDDAVRLQPGDSAAWTYHVMTDGVNLAFESDGTTAAVIGTLVGTLVLMGGCSTYRVAEYGVSAESALALRKLSGNAVRVGQFTSSPPNLKEIMCRGAGPVTTPKNETFSQYVRSALVDELRVAGLLTTTDGPVLTGNLEAIRFDTMPGRWILTLAVASSNGRSMRVSETFPFEGRFFGESACNETARAFMPAIQRLVGKIVRSPAFVGFMAPVTIAPLSTTTTPGSGKSRPGS